MSGRFVFLKTILYNCVVLTDIKMFLLGMQALMIWSILAVNERKIFCKGFNRTVYKINFKMDLLDCRGQNSNWHWTETNQQGSQNEEINRTERLSDNSIPSHHPSSYCCDLNTTANEVEGNSEFWKNIVNPIEIDEVRASKWLISDCLQLIKDPQIRYFLCFKYHLS